MFDADALPSEIVPALQAFAQRLKEHLHRH